MNRQIIIDRLSDSIENKAPIIGVCIGNGRSAKQATKGGADIIATLNAGRFRMSSLPSIASTLPFSSCNDMVLNYAKTEVVPQIDNVPVIFGACAQDPLYGKDQIINNILDIGFDGIINFPTVSLIDGQFREALEEQGEGFSHEVELLKMAHDRGLFTVAFIGCSTFFALGATINGDVLWPSILGLLIGLILGYVSEQFALVIKAKVLKA